jgi:hypothetical protein
MLHFEPFDGDIEAWGRVLETLPDREVFQTPPWLRFLAESQQAEPAIAVLRDGNDVAGYFAGATVRWAGAKILGSPFVGWTTERMGLRLREGVSKRAAAEALARYAFRGLGCWHLEFNDPAFLPQDLEGLGFAHRSTQTYVVDLAADEETIFQRFSPKSCRYSIRKAEKLGVIVEEASDEQFAGDYYDQLLDVFAKQSLVPTYSRKRVELLIKHLLPTGHLLLLRAREPEGRCIATGIFLGMNQNAYFWGNASWRQDQHFCPNEALHWYAMRYWKQRGMCSYDFCGAGEYKRKYGGVPTDRYQFRKSRYFWVATARRLAYRCFKWRQALLGRRSGRR